MRTLCLLLLLLLGAAVCEAAWPTIEFSPALTRDVKLLPYENGMIAWHDIVTSQLVRIPDFLLNTDHRAYVTGEEIPTNTTITVSCPVDIEDGNVCNIFIYVYYCPPCALHGGLIGAALSSGWIAGSCAPNFKLTPDGEVHNMAIFRRQLKRGESASVTTTMPARFVGFGVTPAGIDCSSLDQNLCRNEQHCRYHEGECIVSWCPLHYQGGTQTCLECASEPPSSAAPATLAPPDDKATFTPSFAPPPPTTPEPDVIATLIPDSPVNTPAPCVESHCSTCVQQCRDDVEEEGDCVAYNSMFLELGWNPSRGWQNVAIRWPLSVPKGARVKRAYVTFQAAKTLSNHGKFELAFDSSSNSDPWGEKYPAARTYNTELDWDVTEQWFAGVVYSTPDLTELIQEIVNKPDWAAGNYVGMVIRPRGDANCGWRKVHASDNKDAGAPHIHVEWEICDVEGTDAPATGAPPTSAPDGSNPQCPARVRKSYAYMSCAERQVYANAVLALIKDRSDVYADLVKTHEQNQFYAHGTSAFLPWHRWFILAFETLLRGLPGYACVNLPYWDSEKDALNCHGSPPLKDRTFGDLYSHAYDTNMCVNSGIGTYLEQHGELGCLKRSRTTSIGFAGEAQVQNLIVNNKYYHLFSKLLEDGPHSGPHNFIGGHMKTMQSPYDPLFWIHHANVDRLWAIWQDYHGHDYYSKEQLTWVQYTVHIDEPSERYVVAEDLQLDVPMPFKYSTWVGIPECVRHNVTIRDVWSIKSLPGGHSYTYGVDSLAQVLGPCILGPWELVTPGTLPIISCCGDGTVDVGEQCDDGNIIEDDGCNSQCSTGPLVPVPPAPAPSPSAGYPTDYTAADLADADEEWASKTVVFADSDIMATYLKLIEEGATIAELSEKLAREQCIIHGNQDLTTTEWLTMLGKKLEDGAFYTCSNVNVGG
ncbi:Tyrosinase [Diplonema papillatum]|nr:Tyrosinase [Diplonema papillatum]